jgi:hypothetical protein
MNINNDSDNNKAVAQRLYDATSEPKIQSPAVFHK